MHALIEEHLDEIRAACERHGVKSLSLFGSAVTGEFDAQRSDLDFLVEFEPQDRRGFDDVFFLLAADLEQLLERRVDLVERKVLDGSLNPYRRESIYANLVSLYAA